MTYIDPDREAWEIFTTAVADSPQLRLGWLAPGEGFAEEMAENEGSASFRTKPSLG